MGTTGDRGTPCQHRNFASVMLCGQMQLDEVAHVGGRWSSL